MKGCHCKGCNHWFQLRVIYLCPICGRDDVAERKKQKQEEEERVDQAWRNIWVKLGFLKKETE